ncbi:MAG: glycosyltransferase family 2 protein [Polyangiaceae bacterium]|nr:glycosyltransferase family 2 protein [Polyangiaceae bacterium]
MTAKAGEEFDGKLDRRLTWRAVRAVYRTSRGPTCTRLWRWLRAVRNGLARDIRLRSARATSAEQEDVHGARTDHPEGLIRRLLRANGASCHDTAQDLVEPLRRSLPSLTPPMRRRALPPLVEAMLVLGDQDGVLGLVREFPDDFVRSRRAFDMVAPFVADRLDGIGHRLAAIARARLHPTYLAARWEAGELSSEDVLDLLARHPLRVAMDPTLDLLAYSVAKDARPDVAERALTRFLGAYGLPPVHIARVEGPFFGCLSAAVRNPCGRDGPLVSVIVAARDASETIGYAVGSLLAQSYANLEVLVCDDASTDGTLEVLRRRFGADPRVRLFQSRGQQGTYNIRNHLVPLARGSLVTFHDADDWALPDRLALQVRALGPRSALACLANWIRLRTDGTAVFFRNGGPVRMSMVSLMMGRDLCMECGPFRSARFGADFEFYERLRAQFGDSRIARVTAPLILALWSGSSLTRTAGCESLETGYKSSARRAYAEIVSRRTLLGARTITDQDIMAVLRQHDNYLEATGIDECIAADASVR